MSPHERPVRSAENKRDIEDYHDAPYYLLLKRLPPELAQRHLQRIEDEEMNDKEATKHLEQIAANRKEVTTVSVISDEKARELFAGQEEKILHDIETDVYSNPEYFIGAGNTARVKRYELASAHETLPVAVKYLVTPDENTVSAAEEHDIVQEVKRMLEIEEMEKTANLQLFKTPHAYFHHRNEHIQCYGMQLIDGVTLEQGMQEGADPELLETLKTKLGHVSREEIFAEIDTLFEKVHTKYLHRDVKSANIMVDAYGTFYLIDFGQSAALSELSPQAIENLEETKKSEVDVTKKSVGNFLDKLFKQS